MASKNDKLADLIPGSDQSLSDEQIEQIRSVVQDQIIECLNRFYAMETGMWGSPLVALIIRTIIQGHLQNRLYDLSALATTLDLPLGSVHRNVQRLVDEGYVEKIPSGKSVYLMPTDRSCISLDLSFDEMVETLNKLYRRLDDT